jgi:hypothetical protein
MALVDMSVIRAVAAAKRAGGVLSYEDVHEIIRSVFDHGRITLHERDDLHEVLNTMPMDGRARWALQNFLNHVDPKLAPLDALARFTGDRNQGVAVRVPDPGPFSAFDTDLGKFIYGNFDVMYLPGSGELLVVLKVKYKFEDGVEQGNRTAIRARMYLAAQVWNNAGVTLQSRMFVLNPILRFRFEVREVPSGEHKVVDVRAGKMRENVAFELNIHQDTDVPTLVHELGHVFGNYDEYRDDGVWSWLMSHFSLAHDGRFLSDTKALMNNDMKEFRGRYFDHFQNWVNRHFARVGGWYRVVL